MPIQTLIQQNLSFLDPKPPILKNDAYFSEESLVFKGVNVRGSNVIKQSHENSALAKRLHRLSSTFQQKSRKKVGI